MVQVRGVFNGAALVFFSYIGFDAVACSAEEVSKWALQGGGRCGFSKFLGAQGRVLTLNHVEKRQRR